MNLPAQFVTLRWQVVLEWQTMLVDDPIWHDMSLADMSNKWCQSDEWCGNMTFSQKWFYAKLFKSFFQQFLLREKADIVGVFCFSEDSCLVYKDAMFISPHKFMGGVCTPGKNRDFLGSHWLTWQWSCGCGCGVWGVPQTEPFYVFSAVHVHGVTD